VDNLLLTEIRGLVAKNAKISAVARYREVTGSSLLEAKRVVDNVAAGRHPDAPPTPDSTEADVSRPSPDRRAELEALLPTGWTMNLIHELDSQAKLLDPVAYPVALIDGDDEIAIPCSLILDFGVLKLALDSSRGSWLMGQINDEGTIMCWGDYGEDLGDAIRAL
jgi:hypothetical protein